MLPRLVVGTRNALLGQIPTSHSVAPVEGLLPDDAWLSSMYARTVEKSTFLITFATKLTRSTTVLFFSCVVSPSCSTSVTVSGTCYFLPGFFICVIFQRAPLLLKQLSSRLLLLLWVFPFFFFFLFLPNSLSLSKMPVISMLLFTRVKQNIISWPMILMFYVCAQICYWSWWEVQTKNYIPESSSLLSCVLLLQSWMISQVFVWIIPAKRSLFWFSSGFVCFFQKKILTFQF